MSYRDSVPRMLMNTFFHTHSLMIILFSHNRNVEQDDLSLKISLINQVFLNNDNFDFKSFLKYGFLKQTLDEPS